MYIDSTPLPEYGLYMTPYLHCLVHPPIHPCVHPSVRLSTIRKSIRSFFDVHGIRSHLTLVTGVRKFKVLTAQPLRTLHSLLCSTSLCDKIGISQKIVLGGSEESLCDIDSTPLPEYGLYMTPYLHCLVRPPIHPCVHPSVRLSTIRKSIRSFF